MNDEHPILMNGEMVRAILGGYKTQTRRPVVPQPQVVFAMCRDCKIDTNLLFRRKDQGIACPFGKPGDRLWVREAWSRGCAELGSNQQSVIYRTDGDHYGHVWRPSIHMPRWACRLVLRVEWVRVERVQDISDEDAEAEGVEVMAYSDVWASEVFAGMWDAIYGARGLGWQANPWVWVCGFSVAER